MSNVHDTAALVDAVIERLTASYIFPERSERAANLLRARLEAGSYNLPIGAGLCDLLSADLFEACADRHLRLIWHDEPEAGQDEAGLIAQLREQFRLENHGFRRVERLPGNIGVIELTVVPEAAPGGPVIAAALQLVQHTYALILDLRGTRGGSPDGVTCLCSYFFPDGDVHLNDIVEGPRGPVRQFWTYATVPGPRYLDRPLYAVTSASTFSGGEELAYDLQALGRATVVGERTRGGAHPSEIVSLGQHVELRLPTARARNPVTSTNWEAVGVQPDLLAPAAGALEVAWLTALERIGGDERLPGAERAEARRLLGTRL